MKALLTSFILQVALAQQMGAQPLPFPGMDKSGAAVCEFYVRSSCQRGASCPFRHVRGDKAGRNIHTARTWAWSVTVWAGRFSYNVVGRVFMVFIFCSSYYKLLVLMYLCVGYS